MKEQIIQAISDALQQLYSEGKISTEFIGNIQVTRSKDPSHGDYASNLALAFAKQIGLNPREFAQLVSSQLETNSLFER